MRLRLATAWLVLFAGLPSLATAEAPKKGGTLTYAVTAEAPTTDCHATTTYAAIHVLAPHYSLLLKVDPDNYPKLKPDVAESWNVSADGLTYTFKIRSNAVFHDGSRLTAADVKATFDRLRAPPVGIISIRQALFADIAAIDTPDPATVVMKLKAPDGSFLDTLALPYNCIYSAERLARDGNYPAKTVMGSGPFQFVEHVNGSHWVGKRFDKYWDSAKPYLDGFRAIFIKSQAVVTALQGGQIQAEFRSISPGERTQLQNSLKERITVQESPWVCKIDLLFNTQAKPFDNAKIRQALSMAVDRWQASDALSKITIVSRSAVRCCPGRHSRSAPRARQPARLRTRYGKGQSRGQAPLGRSRSPRPQSQADQSQRQSPLYARRRFHGRSVPAHRRDGGAYTARRFAAEGGDCERRVPGGDRRLLRRYGRRRAAAVALSVEGALTTQHDAQQQSRARCPL
jgi:ABC-type oligopeptide transport system substrate-binding subunit